MAFAMNRKALAEVDPNILRCTHFPKPGPKNKPFPTEITGYNVPKAVSKVQQSY
jgi:hypothetical protein